MSWVLAFLGFAVLIVLHEAGHFAAAKAVGMRVERFSLFFPPLLLRVRRGETEYAIGAVPLGGYVRITGMNPNEELAPEVEHRAYYRQPPWKRIVVILAGPVVNIVLAFLILWGLYWANGITESTRAVGRVDPGFAATGVLRPGDRLLAVDGVTDLERIPEQTATHVCANQAEVPGCQAVTPAVVTIARGGERMTLELRPTYDPAVGRTRLGFSFAPREVDLGPVTAAGQTLEAMWRFTSGTVSTIAQLFKAEKREQLSGVVGSYETTRQALGLSAQQALFVLGVISLSLGIINLFPFLPLDGGHIFWAVAEKVRRRPVAFATMERAGFVGFALVLMLFAIGLTNDIERLQGEGFGIR